MESSRLTRKLLRDVAGATVIRRCVNGLLAQGFEARDLIVVTDSEAIESEIDSWSLGVCCAVREFEATCGSQRIHEFLAHQPMGFERVLIWQADEIVDSHSAAVLRDFFEALPSGGSYNFFTRWDSSEFLEGGVQVCGTDMVAGFTRNRLRAEGCAGLHVGVYLLESSMFSEFPSSIWDAYSENIEMNALLACDHPLCLREFPADDRWNVVQVNTQDDLDHARSIFSGKNREKYEI